MNPKARLVLLLMAGACLVSGVAGGLARIGLPIPVPSAAAFHGAIMVSGFLGTVISLERAVALGGRWAYAAPLASGLGTLLPLAGLHSVGIVLWLAAPLLLLGSSLAIIARQGAPHTIMLAVAAAAWAVGNFAYASPFFAGAPAWWFAFLVLTIAAERVELTRLTPLPDVAPPLFTAIVTVLFLGAGGALVEAAFAPYAYGAALVALAAWLARFDIARHTVKAQGFARYAAVALLGGYGWLAAAGVAWAAGPGWRDAALHALGLGFVFSMIFAHAPLIVPVVLKLRMRFVPFFYVPLALLHGSLAIRLATEGAGEMRAIGGTLNAAAVALFVATVLLGIRRAW